MFSDFGGGRMSTNLSARWSHALVLSIIVLVAGYLGLGVRAFASATISYSIFFTVLSIVVLILPLYFAIRRLRARGAMDREVVRIPKQDWPKRNDRRKPPGTGQKWTVVANERRSKPLPEFSNPRTAG
jgi:uncharacterized membrane protein YbhN (UPF0104 family)